MKKHAFLIQAHAYPELIEQLICLLAAPNHFFYIHIDRRSKSLYQYLKNKYKSTENVFLFSEKKVNWGSSNQFLVSLFLLAKSLECKNMDYFHLISGQDFPLRTAAQLDAFFESVENGYMGFVPDPSPYQERVDHFYFYDLINSRNSSLIGLVINKVARWVEQFQQLFTKRGIRIRPALGYSLYKGSSWWSWNRKIAWYIHDYLLTHPEYVKRFQWTCCCDEVFFHTLIMNSPLRSLIIPDNLRYIDWTERGESLPLTLKADDYEQIINSGALFCRKIDPVKSEKLIELILKNVFNR